MNMLGWIGSQALKVVAGLLVVVLVAANHPAAAQVLFYAEREKDGRVYVFNSPERLKIWEASGEMGVAITLPGAGANGETIVAENETAVDLYNFKHNLPGYERPTEKKAATAPVSYPQVKVGGDPWYLSYQNGTSGGDDYSRFTIKRGYINVNAKITDWFSARFTPDITQDDTGDIKLRVKYAYGKFETAKWGAITRPNLEFGVAHMPWLDFEEHINNYRMQDTMFMERNGLFNSADQGFTFGGLLGPEMDETFKKEINSHYAGRYGSFAVGVYNGGGYHAKEANDNKVVEARLSIRPVPTVAPGLQVSYFGVTGKGNTASEPDWQLNTIMGSYEHKYVVFTGTWVDGKGAQNGKAVTSAGEALERDGWSVFAEAKVHPKFRVIFRRDRFDPDKNTEEDENSRTILGAAYFFAKKNAVLIDYDRVDYDLDNKDSDDRVQVTMQVSF